MIVFTDIPMPITVNAAYSVKGRSKTKSGDYHAYEQIFNNWCLLKQKEIKEALKMINTNQFSGVFFLVWVFKFEPSSILNKTLKAKEAVKTLDTSNRIKVVEDCISETLNINDSYFFDFLPLKRLGNNTVDLYMIPIEQADNTLIMSIRGRYQSDLDSMISYINDWRKEKMKRHKPQHLRSKGKKHTPKSVQNAGQFKSMYSSSNWHKLRELHLQKYPFCNVCGSRENLHVDHKIAHKGDASLFLDESNLETLCHSHHSSKTARKDQIRDDKGRFV